jgi:hypothetical protein
VNVSALPAAPPDGTQRPSSQNPPGPVYVNAAPRPAASARALGVTCAFFGMLAVIGAVAALCSGRLNIHVPAQALRAMFSLGAGLILFLLGTALLGKPASAPP